jgi:predicted  nucleic acid-binding Zn-ribbon protein
MVRNRSLQTTLAGLTLLMAVGCGTGCQETAAGNRDKQAADVVAARARAEQSQAGDAAKKAMQSRLKELELRIDALKAKSKPEKHGKSDGEVQKLQDQVEALRAKLSTSQGRTQEWDKLKEATEEDFRSIEHKLDEMLPSKK